MANGYWVIGFCCLLAFAQTAKAQEDPFLDFIGGTENDGKVFLQWVMKAGTTCDGIRVYRSTDNQHFEQIGRIAGICGSPDFAVGYTFTDENPVLNQNNHYRLELGNLGFSKSITIAVFDLGKKAYRLFPHPVKNQAVLYFENSSHTSKQLSLFDLNGRPVYQAETNADSFQLNANILPSGMYMFQIKGNEKQSGVQGKIIIAK